ncbi:MAG TPA: cytochrome c peroxidase [Flavipsychrobacter sp.]
MGNTLRHTQAGILLLSAAISLLAACSKKTSDVPPAIADGWIRPSHFPEPVYQFGDNEYSKAGFELGRKLFFDPMLSRDGTVSCASCHRQKDAFADGGAAFSIGIENGISKRNSPVVFNMAWNKTFMWDGGVNHIEVMPLAPLTNPAEMGESLANIVRKLNDHREYPTLFKNVFNRDTVDDQQLFWALAQYMSGLISADAKYDRYVNGTATLTADEQEGLILFRQHCGSCHSEPLFTDYSYQNNGIDKIFADSGRYRITRNAEDLGRFKVPTLRNVTLSSPYMHDGRFNTLEEVLAHYADDVQQSPTLSPLLQKNGQPGLGLSSNEQQKIISFLHTLTDEEFINNPYLVE